MKDTQVGKTKMPTPPLGELLRESREKLALNQRTVAIAMGTSQSAISRYEQEVITPSEENMEKLIAVLEMDHDLATMAYWDARVPDWLKVVER